VRDAMIQSIIAYSIVAAAFLWVAWAILLPNALRRRLRSAVRRKLGHPAQAMERPRCGSGSCSGCGS